MRVCKQLTEMCGFETDCIGRILLRMRPTEFIRGRGLIEEIWYLKLGNSVISTYLKYFSVDNYFFVYFGPLYYNTNVFILFRIYRLEKVFV